ncbi:hypothetical protein [Brucella anthropi]|uniref:hypothetical protein n=1 Tax=Brucella anthropi TaxID=529 RepID=UPI001E3BB040|nr:hypothetical protein [Brucella anthropi]UGQ24177.1 hypothetical protein LRL11_18245 [Brucella anthropi]
MSADAMELRKIRGRLDALAGAQWFRSADDRGEFLEAKTTNGELNEIARFHPGALPEEIDFLANAPDMVVFLLRLVDRAIAKARRDAPRQQSQYRRDDFARDAGIKCNDAAFKVFLEEKHGLERPLTADRAAQKLRTILGITSRSELNKDDAAADRWRSLRTSFEAWRRTGQ